MRVLGVTFCYPPDSLVGAWLHTHTVLAALASRGHDVRVLTLYAGREYEYEGVKVKPVNPLLIDPLSGEDIDADVVISHHGDRLSGACVKAHEVGAKHVEMVHGPLGVEPDSDLVVFNSHHMATEASSWVRTAVCRPTVNPSRHTARRGDAVGIINMSAEKGGDVFARVAERMPAHRFFGVQGHHGKQCDTRLANVKVVPAAVNMRRHVWPNIRVLLMPSQHETWGMVGIEAMCSGIPVIAHPTPGLKESLGSAGMFVDRDNIDDWVDAIRSLDDPSFYQQRSQAAMKRASEVASWDDIDRLCDRIEQLKEAPCSLPSKTSK